MLSLSRSNLIYISVGVVVLVLICVVYSFWFVKRREGFQDDASNEVIPEGLPVKLGKEHCRLLNTQLEQYKKVRRDNPDSEIVNLDETIVQLNTYYTKYSCDKYTF
jgi:hypothetical protein